MRWDEGRGKTEPAITNFTHGFELNWNKEEIARE
jgi:hypothetical protein